MKNENEKFGNISVEKLAKVVSSIALTDKERKSLMNFKDDERAKPFTKQYTKVKGQTKDFAGTLNILVALDLIDVETDIYEKLLQVQNSKKPLEVYLEQAGTWTGFDKLHLRFADKTQILYMPQEIKNASNKETLDLFKETYPDDWKELQNERFSDYVFNISIERQNYVESENKKSQKRGKKSKDKGTE